MFQTIRGTEEDAFLSAVQHARSTHRPSAVRMGDNLPSRYNTNIFSCVAPNNKPDPLSGALQIRLPVHAQALHSASYSHQILPCREEQCL